MNKRRPKSFEEACEMLGIAPTLPNFDFAPEGDRQAMIDHYKLVIIRKAIVGDRNPDWGNSNQWKYYPWFDMGGSSGSSFAMNGCDSLNTDSTVGSRLCYPTREDAEYAGKTFADLYKSYYLIS